MSKIIIFIENCLLTFAAVTFFAIMLALSFLVWFIPIRALVEWLS